MQSPHEVRLKLIPNLMFILIFTSTDDAVSRAVGNHIDTAEVRERRGDYFRDRFSCSHVAEEAEAVFVPVLHRGEGVLEDAADGYDEVILVETGAYERAAHVPCAAEDLGIVSKVSFILSRSRCPSCRWVIEIQLRREDVRSIQAASQDSPGPGDHSSSAAAASTAACCLETAWPHRHSAAESEVARTLCTRMLLQGRLHLGDPSEIIGCMGDGGKVEG
jgi:hypothetical protein